MRKTIVTNQGLKIVVMIAMLVVIFAGIKSAADIIVPFILALFLAFVLNPLIVLLEKVRVPRALAVMLVATVVVCVMVFLTSTLLVMLNEFARTLPQYRGIIVEKLRQYDAYFPQGELTFTPEQLAGYIDPAATLNLVSKLISYLSNAMAGLFLLLMTVAFMLLEVTQLPYKIEQLSDDPGKGMANVQRALDSVTRYLVIKTLISVVTGLAVWALLAFIGVRFAFLWGMLAFALNYVPNIGSFIAAIPPIIQTFLFNGVSDGVMVTGGYILINVILGSIIDPKILGRGLGLSTLMVFISLIFWGWLMGPVGMLLSVPLTIVLKIALEPTAAGHKIAILLGEGTPHR